MKTLIFIKSDQSGSLRVLPHVAKALGVTPVHYFEAFDVKCGEQMVEQAITGVLKDKEGVWYLHDGSFPDEGTYFFDRIMAEVDCLLTVRFTIGAKIFIEVNKARLTSLVPGDSFIIPRETPIAGLFEPYNFVGELNEVER